jgi:hypothetical protein
MSSVYVPSGRDPSAQAQIGFVVSCAQCRLRLLSAVRGKSFARSYFTNRKLEIDMKKLYSTVLGAALLCAVSPASARVIRYAGASCEQQAGSQSSSWSRADGSFRNTSTVGSQNFICPVPRMQKWSDQAYNPEVSSIILFTSVQANCPASSMTNLRMVTRDMTTGTVVFTNLQYLPFESTAHMFYTGGVTPSLYSTLSIQGTAGPNCRIQGVRYEEWDNAD